MRPGLMVALLVNAAAPVVGEMGRLGDFEWAAQLTPGQRAEQHVDDQQAHSGKYSLRYDAAAGVRHPTCHMIAVTEAFETGEFQVEAYIKLEGEGCLCLACPGDGRTVVKTIASPTDGWERLSLHLRANPTRHAQQVSPLALRATLKADSGQVSWWLDDLLVTPLYQHHVPKTDKPPVIDGDLSDACWNDEAYAGDPYWRMYNKPRDAKEPTHVWCCYDDEHLYVAFRCVTRAPGRLVCKVTEHDGAAWRDDSAEIFFNPSHDHARYYEYIVTPKEVVFDSKWWREGGAVARAERSETPPGGAWQVDWHYFGEWKCAVEKDAWTAEIALELRSYEERDLQGNPTGYMPLPAGEVAGILFSRNDRVLGEGMSWADCIGSFHEVHQYGHLVGFRPVYTEGYRKYALREIDELQERWDRMHYEAGCPAPIPVTKEGLQDGTEGLPEAIAALRERAEAERPAFDEWVALGKEIERLDTWLDRARAALAPLAARRTWCHACERGRDPEWGFAVVSPMEARVPTWDALRRPPQPTVSVRDAVRIAAARGEAEVIRLRLFSWREQGVRAWLQPTDLECDGYRIDASNVRLFQVRGDRLERCDSVWVAPRKPAEIWCVVDVPDDAEPGRYKGRVQTPLWNRAAMGMGLPVELRVYDFALPKRPSLAVSVGFDHRWVGSRWYGRAVPLGPRDYWPFAEELLRHRVMPREMLADFTRWTGDGLDFSAADEMLARASLEGIRPDAMIAARQEHMGLVSDRAPALRQAISHWRDQTGVQVIPTYVRGDEWLLKDLTESDLQAAIASVGQPEDLDDARRAAARVGVWAVLPEVAVGLNGSFEGGRFAPTPLANVATSMGKKTVWRILNQHTEMSPIEIRMLAWLAYDYRVQTIFFDFAGKDLPYTASRTASGLLYCCTTADEATYRIAPPMPSVQLELLREGLEDYEYLHMLHQLNRRLGKIGGSRKHTRLHRENSWLLKLDYRIIKNVRSYTHDPEVVMGWREALARQIERTRDALRGHGEEGLPGD